MPVLGHSNVNSGASYVADARFYIPPITARPSFVLNPGIDGKKGTGLRNLAGGPPPSLVGEADALTMFDGHLEIDGGLGYLTSTQFSTTAATTVAIARIAGLDPQGDGPIIFGTSGAGAGHSVYFPSAGAARLIGYWSGGASQYSNNRDATAWAVLVFRLSADGQGRVRDFTGDGLGGGLDEGLTPSRVVAGGETRVLSPTQPMAIGSNIGSSFKGKLGLAWLEHYESYLSDDDVAALGAQAKLIGAIKGISA